MTKISIEKPKKEHAEMIRKICSTGWRQTVEGKLSEECQNQTVDFWYKLNRIEKDIENGSYSYVALFDSEVVGVIGGGITGDNVSEVFVLYIDEKYRYQGIGRLLLEALTKDQVALGATRQWVSVQEGNHRGIPFYEARGYIFQEKKITVTETGEEQVSLRYARAIS
ncbi:MULTISPECIES: GNAT family N-acetyltransferase [Bacillaceae]|uniref:GNAT family N-acetyltransferase n=1 Tax=Bacillaceae TaxID=186817 RepID=UPI0004E22694|nr:MULTISPECIES: GNAT family N-acetyltransferase [Bacillaceae]MCF2647394.1 GNAT family N-acetyltransferase [Niallia circulans]CAI9395367.1 Acetyltransferase YpeA [Bacillus sp. T2.9-1]